MRPAAKPMAARELGEAGGFEYADQRRDRGPRQHSAYGGDDQERCRPARAAPTRWSAAPRGRSSSALRTTRIT